MTSLFIEQTSERLPGADGLQLSSRASEAAADDELERASESGVEEEDSCGEHLPECSIARAAGYGRIDGDGRGLAEWHALLELSLKAVPLSCEFTE